MKKFKRQKSCPSDAKSAKGPRAPAMGGSAPDEAGCWMGGLGLGRAVPQGPGGGPTLPAILVHPMSDVRAKPQVVSNRLSDDRLTMRGNSRPRLWNCATCERAQGACRGTSR